MGTWRAEHMEQSHTYHMAVALVSIQTIGSSYLNGRGQQRHLEHRMIDKSLGEKKETKYCK